MQVLSQHSIPPEPLDRLGSRHDDEEKDVQNVDHLEAAEGWEDGLVKSTWDEMPILKVMWIFRKSVLLAALVFTTSVMDGFAVSMSGSIVANKGFIQQFGEGPDGKKKLNTTWVGIWSASINIGQFLGMPFATYISNRWGRKPGFYAAFLFFMASVVCLNTAKNEGVWMAGKLFIGMGIGTIQLIATPYTVEILPTRVRGSVVMGGIVWQSVGQILQSLAMQRINKQHPLDYIIIPRILIGFIGGILLIFIYIPESPWYLVRHGKKEQCYKVLRRLYGKIEGYDFDQEYGIIVRTLEQEKKVIEINRASTWRDIFVGANLRRFVTVVLLDCGGQPGGNPLISTFSTYFFQIAGFADPFLASLIQNCVGLVAVITYAAIIDKVGRRLPFCIAYTLMTISCWLLGAVYYSKTAAAHRTIVFLVCLWQCGGPVYGNGHFLLAAELPPAHLRMKIGGIAWAIQALFGTAVNLAVPHLLAALNVRAGFVFGGAATIWCVFFWLYIPEPKGRAIAEIDEMFEKKIPAWRWANYETDAGKQLQQAIAHSESVLKGVPA